MGDAIRSGRRLEFARVNNALPAVYGAVLFGFEPDLPGHALGRLVGRVDDGDEPVQAEPVTSEVTRGAGRFSGVAVSLKAGTDVVADLDFFSIVYPLQRQAAIADELASRAQYDGPETEPVIAIEPLVPVDPALRLAACLGTWVVPHDMLVAQERREVVKVGAGHLAQD